ncbi:MAG: ribonuclease P protein component [Actinomycetota bacterium]|nr:ribonuclease P protein component [Actinomycetota bacterium]
MGSPRDRTSDLSAHDFPAESYASLRRSSDIGRVRRVGTRRRVGGVAAFVAAGEPGPPRVACVAGRGVGGAVRRNRAKRRLREALRRVPLRDGCDYVVVASGAVTEAPFEVLVGWVRAAMSEEE